MRVVDGVKVHGAFVGEVVEQVVGGLRLRPALLGPEYQVHPLVQICAYKLGLKRCSIESDKLIGVGRPGRQNNIAQYVALLGRP